MRSRIKLIIITILASTIFLTGCIGKLQASKTLNLIVNKKDITDIAMPIVENNRTLVPIRFISEELGAKVDWNSSKQTVLIEKDGNSVELKINSRLINYNNGSEYELSDVEPKLLNQDEDGNLRTYVPLRLVSNALNIGVEWNEEKNNIYIDSKKQVEDRPVSNIKIISQKKDQVITGETELQINTSKLFPEASELKFILIDKGESSGFILAKGANIKDKYKFTPKIEDNGEKILVAAIYDEKGDYIEGQAIAIEIKVEPLVKLVGIKDNDKITSKVELQVDSNFIPLYVKYEMHDLTSSYIGDENLTDVSDPLGAYTWNPMMKDNGLYSIRAIAYDMDENKYYSESVVVEVARDRILTLAGVKENANIKNSVTLSANRNFDVSETEYMIKDVKTGVVSILKKIPYGSYTWNPSPSDSGVKQLFVRVVDRGRTYESKPIKVTVDGNPKLFLEGIGPGQVVNEEVTLNYNSNVDIDNIKYIVTNPKTGKKRDILPIEAKAVFIPQDDESGDLKISVQGNYRTSSISSETIDFKVYQGEFFGPKPIVEKENFISLASKFALDSYDEIGMSAALQTAQAILESGWGQSVPVDKYTGVLSYNLFGIKGEGTLGSVTSNTWEVYNGITYRVDADFRAYNDLEESWKDHKALLLNLDRYKPFTQVMHDYTLGAWALKRAGYATDPNYPIKLINIIKKYDLDELDKVGI